MNDEHIFEIYQHLKGVKKILAYKSETLKLYVLIIWNCHVQ